MSGAPSEASVKQQQQQLQQALQVGTLVSEPEIRPYVVSDTSELTDETDLRKYRALRITLIVLSGVAALLALASFIMDIVLLARSDEYSGYNRRKKEKEEAGGDQSMEGESLGIGIFKLTYVACLIFAVYNLVVLLVCFIITLVSSHRVLAPGCCPAACLCVTVAIGVVLTIVEVILNFVRPPEGITGLGALPIVRCVITVAYLAVLTVCACTFSDDAAHYYQ